jgi:hypothetical protein
VVQGRRWPATVRRSGPGEVSARRGEVGEETAAAAAKVVVVGESHAGEGE